MPELASHQPFRRREWLLVIAVLLMVEYWIFSVSHAVSGDQTVINYVSFASTIASILLAIVAIIYSFVQADAQQTASRAIAAEVEDLRNASSQLADSKDKLEAQLDRIQAVSDKLDGFQELVGAKLDNLGSGFASLQEKLASESKTPPPPQPALGVDLTTIAHAVLGGTTFSADLMTVALDEYVKRGAPPIKKFDFLGKHFAIPLLHAKVMTTVGEGLEAGVQILNTLQVFGLLTGDRNFLALNDELKTYVAAAQTRIAAYTAESIVNGAPAIRASFDTPTSS